MAAQDCRHTSNARRHHDRPDRARGLTLDERPAGHDRPTITDGDLGFDLDDAGALRIPRGQLSALASGTTVTFSQAVAEFDIAEGILGAAIDAGYIDCTGPRGDEVFLRCDLEAWATGLPGRH